MDQDGVLAVLDFLRKRLEDNGVRVSKLILFGSQARGTATEDSDIDVVVVSEDFRGKNVLQRAELVGEAHWAVAREFLVPLDILTRTPEEMEDESSIVASFAREGSVVYP